MTFLATMKYINMTGLYDWVFLRGRVEDDAIETGTQSDKETIIVRASSIIFNLDRSHSVQYPHDVLSTTVEPHAGRPICSHNNGRKLSLFGGLTGSRAVVFSISFEAGGLRNLKNFNANTYATLAHVHTQIH